MSDQIDNKIDQKIKVVHVEQSHSMCGPASLQILLSRFGKLFSEQQLIGLASATVEHGAEHEGMVQAAKEIGGFVFAKEEGTIEELKYFIEEEKLPVIIGWFDKDGDHYSVVVSITDKNIVIVDPATNEPERWLDREIFPKIWFDFVGKDSRTVSWGWYMVVIFAKKKFSKVKGGYYY